MSSQSNVHTWLFIPSCSFSTWGFWHVPSRVPCFEHIPSFKLQFFPLEAPPPAPFSDIDYEVIHIISCLLFHWLLPEVSIIVALAGSSQISMNYWYQFNAIMKQFLEILMQNPPCCWNISNEMVWFIVIQMYDLMHLLENKYWIHKQGSFHACAQPMRDDVTL